MRCSLTLPSSLLNLPNIHRCRVYTCLIISSTTYIINFIWYVPVFNLVCCNRASLYRLQAYQSKLCAEIDAENDVQKEILQRLQEAE